VIDKSSVLRSQARALWPPLLPREHGGWAMLIVPLIVGAIVGGHLSWAVPLTFASAFFAYLARQPLVLVARARGRRDRLPGSVWFWFAVYAGLAGATGVWPVLLGGYWLLVPAAVVVALLMTTDVYLAARRAEMSVAGELFGIAGLSLGGPVMYYVAGGLDVRFMLGLWLLSVLYFGGSVFYIKLKVRVHTRSDPPATILARLRVGSMTVVYHLATIALTGVLVTTGMVPLLTPLAYVPVTCKALTGVLDWRRTANIRRLGMIEVMHSLVFAALLIAAYQGIR